MKPRVRLGEAQVPGGKVLELYEHDGQHEILLDKRALMGSRMFHSEQELARHACVDLPENARALIGGLGLGFTLRTTLDLLPASGRAIQVELMKEVIEWNRGPIGHHADHPLADPRTEVVRGDVRRVLERYKGELDAIMLDVDNGPTPLVRRGNAFLYTHAGLQLIRDALVPGGRVAIWSADDEPSFPNRLKKCGYTPEKHVAHARPDRKGSRHIIFVGTKPD